MIADTAILSSSPIVLIDEIENAGINREKALLEDLKIMDNKFYNLREDLRYGKKLSSIFFKSYRRQLRKGKLIIIFLMCSITTLCYNHNIQRGI